MNASRAHADLEPLHDPPAVAVLPPPREPLAPLPGSRGTNLPSSGGWALRLGLDEVRGIGDELAERIVRARPSGGYTDIGDLTRRVTLTADQAEALATAGALDALVAGAVDLAPRERRRRALWAAGAAAGERPGTLPGTLVGLQAPTLPGMSDLELTLADLWATGVSAEHHPTEFSRPRLDALGVHSARSVFGVDHGTRVMVAGIVTHRQRPATASGVVFINLEDETGLLNIICPHALWVRHRRIARTSSALLVRGVVEKNGTPPTVALSVLADRIAAIDLQVTLPSRDFR